MVHSAASLDAEGHITKVVVKKMEVMGPTHIIRFLIKKRKKDSYD
jgi:hypothetical protein